MTPRRNRPDVTDAELTVLKALWGRGASSIRELTDLLYPEGGTAHYATVQKLLERLEAKAFVRRRQRGRINIYSPIIEREALIARRLRETADKLCEGSLTPLLTQLVEGSDLSRDELTALRRLVTRRRRDRER
jgi:predicted transcriptional regulator